jgi:4'-phosphopantetheinyl transferase
MPLFCNKILSEEIHFMVWKLTETTEELLLMANTDEVDIQILAQITNDKKKREYLGGKAAIMQMCDLEKIVFNGIIKDEHGKPFLKGYAYEISLTHTADFIGVAFSKNKAVGIDVEKPRDQLFKVLNRLCVASELTWVGADKEKATILWSAKEALYKLYGKRKIDFKENLLIVEKSDGLLIGNIKMPDYHHEHKIHVEHLDDY